MMKKFIIALMCVLVFALAGCTSVETDENSIGNKTSMLVEVESSAFWNVVYHRETKVMYAVSRGSSNYGTFTLLVNADGTPMAYGG